MGDVISDGRSLGEDPSEPTYTNVVNNVNVTTQSDMDYPILNQFLDLSGNGTGNKNANGNYSALPTAFFIKPPTNKLYVIARMIVFIRDAGSLDSGKYGNNINLTNGILVQRKDGVGVLENDFTDGVPIIKNTDWAKYCYDLNLLNFGSGDEAYTVRWTFAATGQRGVVLNGAIGESFLVLLNDNFSGLLEHRFLVQGFIEDLPEV